jgi:hypothetical protein
MYMRINELIKPNRIPVGQGGKYLYHTGTLNSIIGIAKSGQIGIDGDILSMSRDNEYWVNGSQGTIQIVLNRKNLEATHAVEPHEDVWPDEHGEEWSSGESEERIWEHPVPFTKQYVVQVNSKIELPEPILNRLEELNIPVKYI